VRGTRPDYRPRFIFRQNEVAVDSLRNIWLANDVYRGGHRRALLAPFWLPLYDEPNEGASALRRPGTAFQRIGCKAVAKDSPAVA